jgi:signal transduction histidine kinase/ActR/RegA family two-component response regulator
LFVIPHPLPSREFVISLLVLICLVALLAFVVVLAARLRTASAYIAELRAQRDRDVDTIAKGREEALVSASLAEAADRSQEALVDAQAALAGLRTERDQSRSALELVQRQRHAFLSGLAHDLRNPLAPLSNGIELLRLTDNDAAGRLRTRGIMERQVGNLMRIADDLSDLARVSGDQPVLQEMPFAFPEMMKTVEERLQPLLKSQDMVLAFGPESRTLPSLRGDAQRLAQAFTNVLTDLVRHSERGSSLVVTATETPAGVVSIRCASKPPPADEPDGSSAGQAANVSATAPLDDDDEDVDASNLGLGVALASQLIALHGGQLTASRPRGTRRARFEIVLPLPLVDPTVLATPTTLAPLAPTAVAPLSVLLADDNADFSHSFGTMLELLGHHVEVVHDGLAAVTSIVGSPPDIAFVDIGMPSLDGVEAVRRVRGQGNTQGVVMVAVTGRGGAEDRARAAEAGFDRYLVKPFAMQDVRDALDAAQANRDGNAVRGQGGFASARV